MASFLSKIKSTSEKIDALASGLFDAVDDAQQALQAAESFAAQGVQFLSTDFIQTIGGGGLGNLTLSENDKLAVAADQGLVNLVINPSQVPITQTPESPTFDTADPRDVVQPAATQPTDVFVDRIGPEPPRDFRGQYPYVHTEKTISGHVNEVDDTPGAERLFRYHRSGTYEETSSDGRRVVKVTGSNWTIVAYDDNIHIEGTAKLNVIGNILINCFNDAKINVAGRAELNAGEDIRMKGKSIHMESHTGDVNIYSAKGIKIHSTTNTDITAAESFNTAATQEVNISATAGMNLGSNTDISMKGTANVSITSGSDMNVLSGAKYVVSSTGVASIKAGENLNMDGAEVHIAEDLSEDATTAGDPKAAAETKKSGLGAALSRETAAVPNAVEEAIIGVDDDPEAVSEAIDELVTNGRITQEEADELKRDDAGAALESDDTPASTNAQIKTLSAGDIQNLPESAINNALKLSACYNLGNLTTNFPAAGQHAIRAQNGLSKARIAANLSLLCQNVLEPIKNRWGAMVVINSAFRGGTSKSQHNKGMAVDITYQQYSRNPDKVIEIAQWIKENIVFDQLIIEYGNNQVWTHVSFDPTKGTNQRRQVLTCKNPANPKYEPGLKRYKAKWE